MDEMETTAYLAGQQVDRLEAKSAEESDEEIVAFLERQRPPETLTAEAVDEPSSPAGLEPEIDVKELRAKADAVPVLRQQIADDERELAMLRAGVDLESALGRFFHDTYTGSPDDVARVVTELGIPRRWS